MIEATIFLSDEELKKLKKSTHLIAVVKEVGLLKIFVRHKPKGAIGE